MSLILDALRRGRGRERSRAHAKAAQTDAVLQTLGYARFSAQSPIQRLKRLLAYITVAVAFGFVLWASIVWLTQTYLPVPIAPEAPAFAPQESDGAPAGKPSAPRFEAAQTANANRAARVSREESASRGPVDKPNTGVKPAPVGSSAILVANSGRVRAPAAPPATPAGAPAPPTALSSPAAAGATITTSENHFQRAVIFQRAGDFENALFHYKQVLQRDDLNVEAHNNLGLLYRDKGLLDDAVREFRRAIAIDPRYTRARNNLGVTYLNQRRLDAAASEFQAALTIDPKNVESLVNLSTVEREAGRVETARSVLVRALVIDARSAEAHYNLALLEDDAGNNDQALSHYRAFLQFGAASHPALVTEVRKRLDALSK